jgi:hypothetical protein
MSVRCALSLVIREVFAKKAFDRKIHGSILQFAAEGETNPRPRLSHCGASESPKEKPAGAAGRGFRRERRSRDEGLSRRRPCASDRAASL